MINETNGTRLPSDAMDALQIAADDFVQAFKSGQETGRFSAFDLVALAYRVIARIQTCDETGLPRVEILPVVEPVRRLMALSPFLRRLQEWPRGYPGDFETIEYMLGRHPALDERSPEFIMETSALSMPICQQHRNKIHFQGRSILQAVLKKPVETDVPQAPPRILSIACGSCMDIFEIVSLLENQSFHLVLNDADSNALDSALLNLKPIEDKCSFVTGNVFRQINTLAKLGPFDLILVGGLLDYLSDKQASFLIEQLLKKLLTESGKLIYTNIANDNPYKIWMEYYGDWMLIERNEASLVQLADQSGVENLEIQTFRDGTNLSIFCEVTKMEVASG